MTDFNRAMRDPKSVYQKPRDVLSDTTLTTDEKRKILKQWELDAHELATAEEENMPAYDDQPTMLSRIKRALHELDTSQ